MKAVRLLGGSAKFPAIYSQKRECERPNSYCEAPKLNVKQTPRYIIEVPHRFLGWFFYMVTGAPRGTPEVQKANHSTCKPEDCLKREGRHRHNHGPLR